jgi:hypothetical protein
MSAPRSNRVDASVFKPRRLLVRLTEAGLKYALSSAIVVVASVTSEAAPPITPAIACARSRSAITSMSGSSLRATLSSVVIVSPGRARRMRISGPARRPRSNACIGWPISRFT